MERRLAGYLDSIKIQIHQLVGLLPNYFLLGFVEKRFGCGYESSIVWSLSFSVLRIETKPTPETDTCRNPNP
jgi:hypothetical protein